MKFFALNQVLVLASFLQVLGAPGALCLPTGQPTGLQIATESPNPALEVKATLEKRDSWDCKGSSNCIGVSAEACRRATDLFLVNPNEVIRSERRYAVAYDPLKLHHCLAMYTCANADDYQSAANAGVSTGNNLWFKYVQLFYIAQLIRYWVVY
ncbi:hypothetical protein TWF281_004901 [Arthrobotrys megalospora]